MHLEQHYMSHNWDHPATSNITDFNLPATTAFTHSKPLGGIKPYIPPMLLRRPPRGIPPYTHHMPPERRMRGKLPRGISYSLPSMLFRGLPREIAPYTPYMLPTGRMRRQPLRRISSSIPPMRLRGLPRGLTPYTPYMPPTRRMRGKPPKEISSFIPPMQLRGLPRRITPYMRPMRRMRGKPLRRISSYMPPPWWQPRRIAPSISYPGEKPRKIVLSKHQMPVGNLSGVTPGVIPKRTLKELPRAAPWGKSIGVSEGTPRGGSPVSLRWILPTGLPGGLSNMLLGLPDGLVAGLSKGVAGALVPTKFDLNVWFHLPTVTFPNVFRELRLYKQYVANNCISEFKRLWRRIKG